MPRRRGPLRDQQYLDFLKREGSCVACQVRPKMLIRHAIYGAQWIIDAAHGPVNGMSSKGPDHEAIPLCRSHHEEQHRLSWPEFCKRYGIDRKFQVKVWNTLYQSWKGNNRKWELSA